MNDLRSHTPVVPYEQRLRNDLRWAMNQGDLFFQGKGGAHEALRKIARRLDELGIPYCVAGGLALFAYGYRRYTEDVDLLVSAAGLQRLHDELEGRGYLPPHSRSKHLRDTELGVKIEFLVAGQFPGDGLPKPVAFPEPESVAVERAGIKYVDLPKFIELKLASGMTGANRERDLIDIKELARALDLSEDFAEKLDPYVRDKYRELVRSIAGRPKRYVKLWRNKWLTAGATSIDQMIRMLNEAAAELEAMRADGVTLDPESNVASDYSDLITTDPAVAQKYGMELQSDE